MKLDIRSFAAAAVLAAAVVGARPAAAQKTTAPASTAAATAAAAAAPAPATAAPTAPKNFVVIVNSANPVQALSRDQLSKLFLKKTPRWPGGREALPVDLAGRTVVRSSFSEAVHRKSVVAINSYWRQQIYAGRDVPPPAMRSERDVVEFVRSTPDAIGYVSTQAELGRSIKIVTVQH